LKYHFLHNENTRILLSYHQRSPIPIVSDLNPSPKAGVGVMVVNCL